MANKYPLLAFACCIFTANIYAQEDSTSIHDIKMDGVVISASKFKEKEKNVVQYIQPIKQKEIEWSMPQTSATMLEQTGKVFVQRSQAGGGSPVIRGFEASRVLLVVDGVRMNNAIYRSGHLQNSITIDNNMLEGVEVLHGPGSTLYGSDALGGVVLFRTKNPKLSTHPEKTAFGTNMMTRYSSANNEATGHIDFNIGTKTFASLTSITYSQFGHTRKGNADNPFYDKNYGDRQFYIQRYNDTDRIVLNSDKNLQKLTAYSQVDLMQKFRFSPNNRTDHVLNLQYSNSSDIPRYDRLTDMVGDSLRYAEWYYGPQERLLAAYNLSLKNQGNIIDEIKAGINYQHIEESRHNRSFGSSSRNNRLETLDVAGYNIDLRKLMSKHELILGTDGQFNFVRSTAYKQNINTGERTALDTRYPDGGSRMFYTAVYAQHIFKIIPDKLILNDGIRLNYTYLNAEFDDTTFFPFPFEEATQKNTALSGNIGLVYMPNRHWRFVAGGATGFRSPNVDDLGKVFDSRSGELLVVPNPDLQPEYTYTADLGINYTDNKYIRIEVNGYYTWYRNAIVQDAYTLNGQTTIIYDGQPTQIVANQNKARAYVYGFIGSVTIKPLPKTTIYSTINYTYGRFFNAGTEVPLNHIPPVYGKTGISYRHKKYEGEIFAMYNGWKRASEYSPLGEDNIRYATPDGMPAWYTLNLRTGYQLNENIRFQLALENIMDQNYRIFASGVNMPGRNLVLSIRGTL